MCAREGQQIKKKKKRKCRAGGAVFGSAVLCNRSE